MNLLPGKLKRNGTGLEVLFPNGERLATRAGMTLNEGQSVLYGIRPEHLTVGVGGLPVEVIVVEPTGADTQLYCKFIEQEVTATIRDRTNVRPGDRITLVPDVGRAHLFDAENGRRAAP